MSWGQMSVRKNRLILRESKENMFQPLLLSYYANYPVFKWYKKGCRKQLYSILQCKFTHFQSIIVLFMICHFLVKKGVGYASYKFTSQQVTLFCKLTIVVISKLLNFKSSNALWNIACYSCIKSIIEGTEMNYFSK